MHVALVYLCAYVCLCVYVSVCIRAMSVCIRAMTFSYVSYQMGEAPTDSCCGGDTVAPIASLGHGVWQLGQDVQDAEVSARP
jgi:hypothetical protein